MFQLKRLANMLAEGLNGKQVSGLTDSVIKDPSETKRLTRGTVTTEGESLLRQLDHGKQLRRK